MAEKDCLLLSSPSIFSEQFYKLYNFVLHGESIHHTYIPPLPPTPIQLSYLYYCFIFISQQHGMVVDGLLGWLELGLFLLLDQRL